MNNCNRTVADSCYAWGGGTAYCACDTKGASMCQIFEESYGEDFANCATQVNAMATCLNTNNCYIDLRTYGDSGSCANMKCKNEVACALSCTGLVTGYNAYSDAMNPTGCPVRHIPALECPGNSGVALVIGMAVLLALLF
jgi:hypothetical protein